MNERPIGQLEEEDQRIADEMVKNLKYLLSKYKWLDIYHAVWRSLANRMCGNVEGRCDIIGQRKRQEYQRLERERLSKKTNTG